MGETEKRLLSANETAKRVSLMVCANEELQEAVTRLDDLFNQVKKGDVQQCQAISALHHHQQCQGYGKS